MRQLTLGVRLTDRALLGNFLAGDNPLALAAARALAAPAGAGALFVHGAAGRQSQHDDQDRDPHDQSAHDRRTRLI